MKKKLLAFIAVPVAAIAILFGGIASCGGSTHKAPVFNDKASDCWAHPDAAGHRHCAS